MRQRHVQSYLLTSPADSAEPPPQLQFDSKVDRYLFFEQSLKNLYEKYGYLVVANITCILHERECCFRCVGHVAAQAATKPID